MPSRQLSNASFRVASRASPGVDLSWLGDFVMGVAHVSTQRENRDAEARRTLLEQAQEKEAKLLAEAQARERVNCLIKLRH